MTNDSGAIAYDGNTMLGNSVSSTAAVYLNGAAVSGCAFAWTAANCTISGANTATVTVVAIDDGESEGTATCRVTGIPNYPNTELVKVFTVAKQYKGDQGEGGESTYTVSIDNDFDSIPADVSGNVSGGYQWQTETTHKVSVYYGKDAQDFTVVDQSGTAPSTGLCLKYKLTNVALGNAPSVSGKAATA